jgi:hypothetical protein
VDSYEREEEGRKYMMVYSMILLEERMEKGGHI